MITRRTVEEKDVLALARALYKAWEKGKDTKVFLKAFKPGDEIEQAKKLLTDESVDSFFVVAETYLVGYRLVEYKYGEGRYLEEYIVIKIHDGPGRFADAVTFLREEAVAWECKGILAATLLHSDNSRLVKAYERYGFKPQMVELMLEL